MSTVPGLDPDAHSKPKLVIFDFDGTLVESEALASEVQARLFQSEGLPLEAAEIAYRFAGVPVEHMISDVEDRFEVSLRPSLAAEMAEAFDRRVASDLRPTEGAEQLLSTLRLPFCVASNTPRPLLIKMLRATDLLRHVGPRFFSAHDVGIKKPDPALFLLAAEAMRVPQTACLVVEDSVTGVQAAKSAGMPVVAFAGGRHQSAASMNRLRASRPLAVLEKLEQLGSLVAGHRAAYP